jgi:hypothetical protein
MTIYDSTLIQQGYMPSITDDVPTAELPEGVNSIKYIGYFKDGNPSTAIIERIEKSGRFTYIRYPFGQKMPKFDWDERENYPYEHDKN